MHVDILLDHKTWPTPAIALSSLAHTLILGLSFLKLTKLKIDFETNIVEIGSKVYSSGIHCIKSPDHSSTYIRRFTLQDTS